MSRTLMMVYALVCYLIFLAVFLYLIAFVEDFPILAEFGFANTVNEPVRPGSVFNAILIDVGLIALFGVQHTIMARQAFKQKWTKIVPEPVERSTFVLITSLILILLFYAWQPIGQKVWDIESEVMIFTLSAISLFGWGVALLATMLLGHFSLFGVAQAWHHFIGVKPEPPTLREPSLYKYMRHPLYFGFLLAFWSEPAMTLGHLVFATAFTVYILIGIRYEEKDMVSFFGEKYKDYQRRVSMLIPRPPKK